MGWPTRTELELAYSNMRRSAVQKAIREGLLARSLKLSDSHTDSAEVPITLLNHPISNDISLHDIKKCNMVCMFVDMTSSTRRKQSTPNFWDFFINQIYLYFITSVATCDESKGKLAGYRGDGAFFVWFYKDEKGYPTYAEFDNASLAIARAVKCAANIRFSVNTILRERLAEDNVYGEVPYNYIDDLDVRIGIDVGELILTRVGINEHSSELTLIGKQADIAAKLAGRATPGEPTLTNNAKKLYPSTQWGTLEFQQKTLDLGSNIGLQPVYSLKEKSANILIVIMARYLNG